MLRRAAAVLTVTVSAATGQTYSATTVGAPTFNRAIASCAGLSGTGSAVRYHVQAFSVTASGNYTLAGTGTSPALWDTFVHLYQTAFVASSPLTNCLVGNDDGPTNTIGTHGFTFNALVNTQYFLVTSAYSNTLAGAFTNTFSGGPGTILFGVVPEPATLLLVATGLAVLLPLTRRRRATRARIRV
jgi:hypothetical protein